MKIELIKTSYSVAQNGLFENFTVKIDKKKIFEWSDNCGYITFQAAGDPSMAEKMTLSPSRIRKIHAAMLNAHAEYEKKWEKMDGNGVYARDVRTDEFGADWEKA